MTAGYEGAVIGGILAGGSFPVIDIAPGDFSDVHYAKIWAAIGSLHKDGKPLEWISVREELQSRSASIETLLAIDELVVSLPDPANIDWYARKIASASRLRMLSREAGVILQESKEFHDAAERITNLVQLLQKGDWHGFQKIHTLAAAHVSALESGGMSGHSSGLTRLDEYLFGLRPGHVYIVGGRPSNGKTMLALSISRSIARNGSPVAYFLLESSGQQLASRLLTWQSGLPSVKLMSGGPNTSEEWGKIAEALDGIVELPLFVDESSDLGISNLRNRITRAREEFGASFIVVDYMQLVDSRGDSERERMNATSSTLRKLAKELSVPIMALSQLSRLAAYERPSIHHLKESGNIEADADVVLMVFRHKALAKTVQGYSELNSQAGEIFMSCGVLPTEEIIWVEVAKNRQSGREGLIPLLFNRETGELKEVC